MKKTACLYSDKFLLHSPGARSPENALRLETIKKRLSATGLSDRLFCVQPGPRVQTVRKAILSVHSAAHYNSVVKWHSKAVPPLLAVSAVLTAIDLVMKKRVSNAFCAVRPPGHHAHNNGAHCDGNYQGEGFCFFNNAAVGARYAQKNHGCKKILIVDWDYHHGNGTEWAFYKDPTVFYFSTHSLYDYPVTGFPARKGEGRGLGYNLNVPLAAGASDHEIHSAFKSQLLPALEKKGFVPDLIIISAGFDSRKDDFIGHFTVTDSGFAELTKFMMGLADIYCEGRIVSVLEGGYNPAGLAQAVCAHLRALMNATQIEV
ncbi:MAG: histone deacetylase [Spirochaetaceae bacterium]|nr:MAG: histone deacetylase [Spirochaetaceae bacterium]